ncbi:9168_t:CDS:10, partial [Ambispora gerdemannii]
RFKKTNGGYMLRDLSKSLEVLSIHAELRIEQDYRYKTYYRAITKKESITSWIPLLSDYCVIGKFGNIYAHLEIQHNNKEYLIYHWRLYEDMEISRILGCETKSDFFASIIKHIKQSGEISIPDILGLRNAIQDKIIQLTTVMQRKGEKLLTEIKAQTSLTTIKTPIIHHGIEIKDSGIQLSPEATLALAIDYKVLRKSNDASRKRIKKAKADSEYVKNLKYKLNETKNQELLDNWIQKVMEETNIRIGYSLRTTIKCKLCKEITEYNNESPDLKFSILVAGAGLVGDVNRQQLQTILSMIGITAQSSKNHYHEKQNEYSKIITSGQKLDDNKISVSEAELEKVQIDSLVAYLSDNHNLCWNKVYWIKENPDIQLKIPHLKEHTIKQRENFHQFLKEYKQNINQIAKERDKQKQRNSKNITKRNQERAKKIQEQRSDLEMFNWDKFKWYQEFPNKKYMPQNSKVIELNPPTPYDVLIEVFDYQEFRDIQEWAILTYVSGLTIIINPLMSLIDDQVIETIAAGIGYASVYAGEHQPLRYFEKVFSEIAIGLTRIIYITAESFINNESFTKMLLKFAERMPISFIIDEAHCIIECNHFRESWGQLEKISILFPNSSIMMLTGTCKEVDAHAILENLHLAQHDVAIVRGTYFSHPELTMEVHSKNTKEKTVDKIITLLEELKDGKCIIYCSMVHACNDVYEQLCEKSNLQLAIANNIIQLMIATSAFGMGLNDKRVRLVIHYTFPLSISMLVQETGRAGRDRNSAKSVIFYTRHDVCTNYNVITQGKETGTEDMSDSTEAIKRQLNLAKGWQQIFENESVQETDVESNALKMVETVEKVLDHEELASLEIYSDENLKHGKLVRTKADALHLLDWLIVCGVIKVMIDLYRPNSNRNAVQTNIHILGAVEGATAMIAMK